MRRQYLKLGKCQQQREISSDDGDGKNFAAAALKGFSLKTPESSVWWRDSAAGEQKPLSAGHSHRLARDRGMGWWIGHEGFIG